MSDDVPQGSIFQEADEIVRRTFGLRTNQNLKHRSVSQNLVRPTDQAMRASVSDLYNSVASKRTDHIPSKENWRTRPVTRLSNRNKSPEVLLERSVAMLAELDAMRGWVNQVPIASGLVDGRSDKRAALDLVRFRDNSAEFIELKWASDTPAYAAIEILRYGIAYLYSFVNSGELGYSELPMMKMGLIHLQVVAPSEYYEKHNLHWLELDLDREIGALSRSRSDGRLSMGFQFLKFPEGFHLPFRDGAEVKAIISDSHGSLGANRITEAFDNLAPVWCMPEKR